MPILTIQKQLRTVGRIRIGAKVATKSGGSRPSKLESFRVTSPDESVIKTVAEVFGGEPQLWDGAAVGKQWEVYTSATEFDVIVPSADFAFSQWLELWGGGGCLRRCDGVTNILTDGPCLCDSNKPDCKPTTRLNVMLAAIQSIGVFRLESHGFNSAAELGGAIEVLRVMQEHGASMVPGRLQLEQRQSKRVDPDTGKTEVFNYSVPTLDFKINIGALAAASVPTYQLPVTPIQSEPPALPSVSEQIQATTPDKPKRANAAAPLPSTGLKPRGMNTAVQDITDHLDKKVSPKETKSLVSDKTPGGASRRSFNRLMAVIKGNKTIPQDDEGRHAWAEIALNHPVASFNDLTQAEVSLLSDVATGERPLIPDTKTEVTYDPDDPSRPF